MNPTERLRSYLTQLPAGLTSLSESQLTQQLPGKWSRKEMLGHLIDSAINNLKRFTDAQFTDGPYSVQSYNQNALVRVNQYHTLPLDHLLTLWQSLNRQILVVIDAIPDDVLARPIRLGNQEDTDSKTLAWLINDYVAHLEHHVKTLL